MADQDVRIVLLEGIHRNALEALNRAGFSRVELLPTALEGEALREALAKAEVVGVRSRTQLTAPFLEAAPHLRAIGCFCIGTNQVALDTAQNLGIPVFNAPYSNTRSVACALVRSRCSSSTSRNCEPTVKTGFSAVIGS